MEAAGSGAAAVVDADRLVGIMSERDVMLRVVAAEGDPKKTAVADVMTKSVQTLTVGATTSEALELMVSQRVRHVPILNQEGKVVGLLSMLNLLRHHVEDLVDQLRSLEAYISADGPGG
jgi:CBS domain-containing protein